MANSYVLSIPSNNYAPRVVISAVARASAVWTKQGHKQALPIIAGP
jgi:hypothetical protein